MEVGAGGTMVPGGGNGAKGKLGWWSQRVVAEGAQWCMMDGGEGREKKECESVRELFLSISFFKKNFFWLISGVIKCHCTTP